MVTDLDASTAFYESGIGLEPDHVGDGSVEFETGQATLVLEKDFDPDVLDAFGLDDPSDDRGNGIIVAVEVEDPEEVDTVCERGLLKPFGWNRLTSSGGDGWHS